MYVAFLIFLAVSASVGINLSYKKGAENSSDPLSSPPLMCTFASILIAFIFAVMGLIQDGGISFPNRASFLYAAGCGTAYAFAAFFYLAALASGPYTLSVIVLNVSSFMPILYSAVFLGEDVSLFRVLSLVLMLTSCILLTLIRSRGASGGPITLRWVIFALLTFLSNGFISFFIRVNVVLAPETSSNSFFVFAYLLSAVICFIFFAATGGFKKKIRPKPLFLPAAGVAGSLAVQLAPSAVLPKILPSAVQYPLVNGGSIILGVVWGVAVFKEKINIWGYICVAAIIASMFLIGLAG